MTASLRVVRAQGLQSWCITALENKHHSARLSELGVAPTLESAAAGNAGAHLNTPSRRPEDPSFQSEPSAGSSSTAGAETLFPFTAEELLPRGRVALDA